MIRINGKDVPSTIDTPSDIATGTYHLAANPNLYEIQRTNNFEFIVTGLAGNEQEVLRLSVISSSVPHFTQSPIEVKRGNNTIKFAGTPTFDSGTLVINDYIGADSKKIIMDWQRLSYNPRTQKVGIASDYKKDCALNEYTPDGQLVRTFKLYGCWVSGISESDRSFETNDKSQISITIEYDHADIEEE